MTSILSLDRHSNPPSSFDRSSSISVSNNIVYTISDGPLLTSNLTNGSGSVVLPSW